jgi:lipoprotein-anchoring transpeptidase ErfK/SrfK
LGKLFLDVTVKEAEFIKYMKQGLYLVPILQDKQSYQKKITSSEKKLGQQVTGNMMMTPKTHRAVAGDTLEKIARQYKVPVECLFLANFTRQALVKDPTTLRIGDPVTVSDRMPVIRVSKSKFKMELVYDDKTLLTYPVAIGAVETETPVATFQITDKAMRPPFKGIPYGHPDNPIGEVWMEFNDTASHQGFGIHGTREPNTIGTKASNGCIRLKNEDVVELQKFVPKGTTVVIEE